MALAITVLAHYPPTAGLSMRAFVQLLCEDLEARGHRVRCESAPVLLGRLRLPQTWRKWLGYVDCFVLYPLLFRCRQLLAPAADLYVLSDQALGPWLPLLGCQPHVIHCHDFLALDAALAAPGQHQHRIGWSGRLYQRLIRWGFGRGRCFLSVSQATRSQLHARLRQPPLLSAVLLNPVPERFAPRSQASCAPVLQAVFGAEVPQGFLLHVGRGWYKNRLGVLQIWERLRAGDASRQALPLVLVGALEPELEAWVQQRPALGPSLWVLDAASDDLVVALYNRAAALLFPSYGEGFGWPVLEALACGCAVVATAIPPLLEVGGPWLTTMAPAPPPSEAGRQGWVAAGARALAAQLGLEAQARERQRQGGLAWVGRFRRSAWGDQLAIHYQQALQLQLAPPPSSAHAHDAASATGRGRC